MKHYVINSQIWRNHAVINELIWCHYDVIYTLGKPKCINVIMIILTLLKPYKWYKERWITSKWTKVLVSRLKMCNMTCYMHMYERKICVDSSICVLRCGRNMPLAMAKHICCLMQVYNMHLRKSSRRNWKNKELMTAAVPQDRWSQMAWTRSIFYLFPQLW